MTYIVKRNAYVLFIILVLFIASFMFYALERNTSKQIELHQQKIKQEAIAHFNLIVVTRHWNALYQGVFVKAKKGLKANAYLKNNQIKDENGNILIRINPAWMMRQIAKLANEKNHYYYKIASLKPLNPQNSADAFELEALQFFELHKGEKYYSRLDKKNKQFNFMGALEIKKECLACHATQNYKLGDIRGGIRISIPSEILQAEIKALQHQAFYNRFYILLSVAIILLLFYRFLNSLYAHHKIVESLNSDLEEQVKHRTRSLEKMYRHEKYIKDLLKTVTGVNEMLLTSISAQNVLNDSADKLAEHKHYHFTWIGLVKNDLLEVTHKSDTHERRVRQGVYSLVGQVENHDIETALEAISLQKTTVKFCANQGVLKNQHRRASDYQLRWQLAVPLINHETDEAFGVFNIYSDREQGFEKEEVELLENIAVDINLILYSHKQQAILEKMELARISNYEETILAFVNIIEQRDTYTAGHTLRVAEYCKKIAIALKIDKKEIKKLEQAAILHDIGKVATPDAVLLKPGKVNPLEYDLIKQHAYAGYKMLSKIEMYKDLAEIIRYHHIRYDGKGYPRTKSPDEAPFLSHIMVVADAFDAMTTNRIYKPRLSVKRALSEIENASGSQFHPLVAAIACQVLEDISIEATTQLPNSDLEQKRFSYFFGDGLTELYNESYLQMMLSNINRKHNCLYLIFLRKFSQYNKTHGWQEGNKLLISIANKLTQHFSDAIIFRFHGDDFVLLFEKDVKIERGVIQNLLLPKEDAYLSLQLTHTQLTADEEDIDLIYDKLKHSLSID